MGCLFGNGDCYKKTQRGESNITQSAQKVAKALQSSNTGVTKALTLNSGKNTTTSGSYHDQLLALNRRK